MSAKWQRSKAWDDEHIPPALWPVRWLLRTLSSVWLGVGLLCCVVVYAVLASVPIGLLARVPTLLIIAATLVLTVGVVAVLPAGAVLRFMRRRGVKRSTQFAAGLAVVLLLAGAAVWIWLTLEWPLLRYDPGSGAGLLLFRDFVTRNQAVTLRRLPGVEMSELEFYAWWPLRLVLILFVVNMVVATVRRIEFTFRNVGVLAVHTGIVAIAMGSVYYSVLKREGDTVLIAGNPDRAGNPTPGPAQDRFFDNTRVALYIGDGRVREQRLLSGVPRYNDYGLDRLDVPAGATTAWALAFKKIDDGPARSLSLPVPPAPTVSAVDPSVRFRVVGYASYARGADDWVAAPPVPAPAENVPLRMVYLFDRRAGTTAASDRPVLAYTLLPAQPSRRLADAQIAVEYTLGPRAGMTEQRWRDLCEPLPPDTRAALVVEVPEAAGGPYRGVFPAGSERMVIGNTGYTIEVKDLMARPPFPIITPGYRDAESSVAIVRITPPSGKPFDRWVYSRFPEISQDMLDETNPNGMPKRRDADPAIRVSFIDASPLVQVFFDEPSGGDGGPVRALVRQQGGQTSVIESVHLPDGSVELAPGVFLTLGERWANARRLERPEPVPPGQRDKSLVGTHDMAMLGVEVSKEAPGQPSWATVVWLPFTKYTGIGQDQSREVRLPDGRMIDLTFGRYQHRLPGFAVQLLDFAMIAYDHRGSPRDYQSIVRVTPVDDPGVRDHAPEFHAFEHVARLNEPLTAPFRWSDERSWLSNVMRRLASGISPNQYKFSQAGWDQEGWMATQREADRGLRPRPVASYTILGVGNNPGIHIIAGGAVLMGLGIPWAFYLKPWLVRREKLRIQREVAAGTYRKPGRVTPRATRNGAAREEAAEPVREGVGS